MASDRVAIRRIQSRLGNVQAGRLSLAQQGELAGAVAVADTSAELRTGALSLSSNTTVSEGDVALTSAVQQR